MLLDSRGGYTPTPAVSRAILAHNAAGGRRPRRRHRGHAVAQPAADGGFKYNPPDGGPAGTDITGWIQDRANALLARGHAGRPPGAVLRGRASRQTYDFLGRVRRLRCDRCRRPRRDPRGRGADRRRPARRGQRRLLGEIGERYGLDLTVVNPEVDPTFRFMTLDWDGKIRMDCSSPYAMASLIARQHDFDIATGNDTDADRHGIVTPGRRADEPEPLPRRRHQLPVRTAATAGRPTRRSARRWSAPR